jgi:tetratricopeptide (TPR) repeat protein
MAVSHPKLEPFMTEENENTIGPQAKRPIFLSPWLVALAALALYGVTLNHWVTFRSLPLASQIMGWDWHPAPLPWRANLQYQPLFLIFTYPLRLLPLDWRVMGLNVLTALCAALTLAILARSVRLLSHDRTNEQRVRTLGEYGLLSLRVAFVPAAFAVLLLAGQLTFWENAVSGTGEMIDLLVFAFLILCLLEYSISRSERRLHLFTFVYGLGVANNWALIGFFPCFLVALIWIKGISFFQWRSALRLAGWGALGLLLYGLAPILGAIHHDCSFGEVLHQKLTEQHLYLTKFPRYFAAIAALRSLVPLVFAGIRWPSTEGDLNPGARDLTRGLLRVLHVVFLAVGVMMFFDVRLSASPRNMGMGVMTGVPGFLTFYYLAALSVGYFSGYVLLVFGKDVEYRWGQAKGLMRAVNWAVAGSLWVAAVGLPVVLFIKNYPCIQDFNNPVVAKFGNDMANSLPARPAVVLADEPARLYLAMDAARRQALPAQYTFIESRDLVHREYLRYLAAHNPSFGINLDRIPEEITSHQVGDLLGHLSQLEPVYYLHPSFGSYFERVYMTPHRLGGYLHAYPPLPPAVVKPDTGEVVQTITTNALDKMELPMTEIVTNQAYWHKLEQESLVSLPNLAQVTPDGMPVRSADAVRIAGYYSQMLDSWGVELQKAALEIKVSPQNKDALLKDADYQFGEALRLNPKNIIARANQEYNAYLRGALPAGPLINAALLAADLGSWDQAYNLYGPADVPALDLMIGRYFARYGAYTQAAHLFQRCLELSPDYPLAELDLAKTYIDMGMFDPAIALLHAIPDTAPLDPLERVRVEAMAYAKKNEFTTADEVLTKGRAKNPKIENFAGVIADFYRLMGYSVLHESKGDPAKEKDAAKWFQKSLAAFDEELKFYSTPMEITAHEQEIPGINLERTEMQMMLKEYSNAIVTSTAMLRQYPDSPVPRLNRAISELQLNQLEAAKNDYQVLEKLPPGPSSFMVYFGLAQVAQKQSNKMEEIRCDRLYLQYAPTNTAEFTNITLQLRKLEGR